MSTSTIDDSNLLTKQYSESYESLIRILVNSFMNYFNLNL